MKYLLAKNTVGPDDIDALCDWLKTYPKLTKGDLTIEMEKKWAKWVGRRYAVFCNSGSSANLLAVYALKCSNRLKNNKAVVVSTGWVTTLAPFMQFGFDVHMCASDSDNFGVDLNHLNSLCEDKNPAVVIVVDPLGILVDKGKLLALQMKYGFYLIMDDCAALGSKYSDGMKAGSVGDLSTFSLFFAHQASCGEGGLVFTDDRILYNILVSLRSHAWLRDMDEDIASGFVKLNNIDYFNQPFTFIYPGFNLRALDLQAFLGIRQIEKLDQFAEQRHKNHMRYAENLKNLFKIQKFNEGERISSISFAILAANTERRKDIVANLLNNGIETRMYSAGALYKHQFFENVYGDSFHDPVSDRIHDTGLFLPNTQEMTEEDVDYICKVVRES